MQLYSVLSNIYKLDGGAMFGNAPKVLWERWMPADEQNRIRLATRGMLAFAGKEVIVFEAGIGAYLDPKYRERFGVDEPELMLLKSLAGRGVSPQAVTRIFLTHLHFDHAGGLLSAWQEGQPPELLFPNARYYVSEQAWERATHPHLRDRASFIPRLHQLLEASRRLEIFHEDDVFSYDGLDVRFFPSQGHTPGMMCFDLRFGGERLVFASDLIPGRTWVHLPISMGYDRYPELLIDEKSRLLADLEKEKARLFYVHDPEMAVSRVRYDPEKQTYEAVAPQRELVIGER
jgi:glyoxylase-like metal-dependent hydrolase (beta-lactamase superfamily II)